MIVMKNQKGFTVIEGLIVLAIVGILVSILFSGVKSCSAGWFDTPAPKSSSGVQKAVAKVKVGADGLTTEQRNVKERLEEDNRVGAIKHLYIISAYSGQVILYSTVRGKVTSSGKRLTPSTVTETGTRLPVRVNVDGEDYHTNEVLGDDGTYGGSVEYLYWWDSKGVYHQHYVTGGQIPHICSQPMAVKSIIINLEQ